MGKLNGLGRTFFSSMIKGAKRTDALRKRKIEKELREMGFSRMKSKMKVADLDNGR